jgi:DNA invertase Pin-like site-specific DNA recombinase
MVSAQEKIKGQHLERLAIVYLRQSSPRQVRENTRSTERQYALADEAVRLGWEPGRVVVLDGDLGISGRFSDTQAREGYKQLVARVCLGEVGAIFGLEIARLARSSAELQRLLEFCGLTDTLVLDTDGVYDLKDFNDRLLLGLKSQMSEAELHIITSRLQGAKRAAAQRGELRFPLPVGYAYDEEGQTIIDPDEEVRAVIADLFRAFAQTGSAYGVVGAFKGRRFPKRAYGGAWAGELRWGELTHPRVLGVLSNPCYAGAYVFGRYRSRRAVRPDGTITTKITELPRAEWPVLIRDHHQGYVSWECYLANERRLAEIGRAHV